MSAAFDPYFTWLGIPPQEQPPDCYRLLGLRLFEDQPEVIEQAADERVGHLKSVSAGEHAALAQKLLNRVAAARVRLLDPHKKAMYDRQLREEVAGRAVRHAGEARTATWTPLGQLGEYQLLEKLGEGGMGAVYKALHTRLGRVVALKLLPQDRLPDEQALARFDREMKAVGTVDHPNVVRATDAREVEGTRFLVMEYVEGADLDVLGRQCHPLPVADACEIVRQAALGLEDVHRHGLVHRDVKPSNLMVTPRGLVKLLDLGLARFQFDPGSGDEVTGTGMAMGTVDYMAPEQITDSRSVDIRADIYSLGCTLYKLLAGRTPFSAPAYKTAGEKMAAHLRDLPPPISKFRKDLPAELARLLERLLAKEPAKRPARPGEVADAIGPLAAGSNLAALVARAQSEPAAAAAEQALVATQEKASSPSWTQFLRQIVGPADATAARHLPRAARPRKLPVRPVAALAVAAGVLAAVVLGAIIIPSLLRGGPGHATLVFDWSEAERRGAELVIDGEAVSLPDAGPWEFSCSPGEHALSATRPGYRLAEQRIAVQAGQRRKVAANWLPLPNLKLDWPRGEREGAILEIDGQVQEIDLIAARSSLGTLELRLPPGEHTLRITRLGFAPVERRFEIVEGKETSIRPEWKGLAAAGATSPLSPAGRGDMKEPSPAGKEGTKPAVAAKPIEPKPPEEDPAEKRRRQLAARWAEATGPAEKLIAAWDFAGAQEALTAVRFDEPEPAARLASRRDEVTRMGALKAGIIARINAAKPRLKKSDLGIRGLGGEVVEASEAGITAKLISGKTESLAWSDLGEKAVPKLLQLAVSAGAGRGSPDPAHPGTAGLPKQPGDLRSAASAGSETRAERASETRAERADDWLASGLVALASANPPLAERCFDKARELGMNIDAYLVPLAEASLARVAERLEKKDFVAAEAALQSLESKYAATAWLAANRRRLDAARAAAKAGIREAEAEKLYAEAAGLYQHKELFDLKPLVDQLKTSYADTAPLAETARKPSFADLEKAVANLGKRLIVRQDGNGDFKTIQAAIDAAPAKSLIEVRDNGPFYEKVLIPADKPGTTLRGGKGFWPVIRSGGPLGTVVNLVRVDAQEVTIERLVITHTDVGGGGEAFHPGQGFRVRRVLWSGGNGFVRCGGNSEFDACAFVGALVTETPAVIRNVVHLTPAGEIEVQGAGKAQIENVCASGFTAGSPADLRCCTFSLLARFNADGVRAVDSIFGEVIASKPGCSIEFCDVTSGKFVELARPGKGCFNLDPQFVDPQNSDFRLRPNSPCRSRASDGGDVGFRYTPEVIEMLKLAFDLRRRGIIKF